MDLEIIQCLLHTLVFKVRKLPCLATGAWPIVALDFFQASFAEVLATACGLVGLSQDVETDRTLCCEDLGRRLHKLTLKTSQSLCVVEL